MLSTILYYIAIIAWIWLVVYSSYLVLTSNRNININIGLIKITKITLKINIFKNYHEKLFEIGLHDVRLTRTASPQQKAMPGTQSLPLRLMWQHVAIHIYNFRTDIGAVFFDSAGPTDIHSMLFSCTKGHISNICGNLVVAITDPKANIAFATSSQIENAKNNWSCVMGAKNIVLKQSNATRYNLEVPGFYSHLTNDSTKLRAVLDVQTINIDYKRLKHKNNKTEKSSTEPSACLELYNLQIRIPNKSVQLDCALSKLSITPNPNYKNNHNIEVDSMNGKWCPFRFVERLSTSTGDNALNITLESNRIDATVFSYKFQMHCVHCTDVLKARKMYCNDPYMKCEDVSCHMSFEEGVIVFCYGAGTELSLSLKFIALFTGMLAPITKYPLTIGQIELAQSIRSMYRNACADLRTVMQMKF